MPYIAPEVITEAKRMDLLTYLSEYEPEELVKFSSNTYTTKTHDSLKISNGKWMWWSERYRGQIRPRLPYQSLWNGFCGSRSDHYGKRFSQLSDLRKYQKL